MIDRPVALVCTGHGTHPVRELVVLQPVRRRVDVEQVLEEQGHPPGPPSPAVLRGFDVETSMVTIDASGKRVRRKADARIIETPGIGWQVVVSPGCPTCGQKALVQPVAAVAAHVAAHFSSGDPRRVDLDVAPGRTY